jgi:hypothetical protein
MPFVARPFHRQEPLDKGDRYLSRVSAKARSALSLGGPVVLWSSGPRVRPDQRAASRLDSGAWEHQSERPMSRSLTHAEESKKQSLAASRVRGPLRLESEGALLGTPAEGRPESRQRGAFKLRRCQVGAQRGGSCIQSTRRAKSAWTSARQRETVCVPAGSSNQ